jgi:hypothetical protein
MKERFFWEIGVEIVGEEDKCSSPQLLEASIFLTATYKNHVDSVDATPIRFFFKEMPIIALTSNFQIELFHHF